MNLYSLIQRTQKTTLFVIFSLLLLSLTTLGTFYEKGSLAVYLFNRAFRYNQIQLDNIQHLSAGVDIGYFEELMGNPVFINFSKDNTQKEYIFVHKLYYVQAITKNDGQVLAYSVTTRNVNFNPSLSLSFQQDKNCLIELGKTHFSDLACFQNPDKLGSYLFAHDLYYFENYYFGNPGNYQTYAFALNEAGFAGIEDESEEYFALPPDKPVWEDLLRDDAETWEEFSPGEVPIETRLNDQEIKDFRTKAIINTYAVTAPYISDKDLKEFSVSSGAVRWGPNYNQVRILPR